MNAPTLPAAVCADIDAPCCPWAIDLHSNPRRNTMIVEAQVTINGSKAAIWAAITNIGFSMDVYAQ
jgi:hypothetical protein